MRVSLPALLLLALLPCSAVALEAGQKAPALAGEVWLQGKVDLSAPDGKTVRVLEWWSTSCGPCRESFPHLNRLASRYAGKGIEFVAIALDGKAEVESFLKQIPIGMPILCGLEKEAAEPWIGPDFGVPHTFVIGKDGLVLWEGHPMDGLDRVLSRVAAGTFDPAQAAKVAEGNHRLQKAAKAGDADGVFRELETLISLEPDSPRYHGIKVQILGQAGRGGEVPAAFAVWEKGCAASAEGLSALALIVITQEDYAHRDPVRALRAAKKAVELSAGKESGPLLTLAKVQAEIGQTEQAVATAAKARALPEADAEIAAVEAYFRRLLEARGK